MSKRSRRLGKKNELQAVEEAIGAALGKRKTKVAEESRSADRELREDSQKAGSSPGAAPDSE
ncbi:MAG: hypothetical protein WBM24_10340 [Candidatus Sulfotelmatobacter sp.]